jgi:hypothetical protein
MAQKPVLDTTQSDSHNFIIRIELFHLEPTTGIEPVNLILTKDVLYLLSYVGTARGMERETGFEPATLSLEG